MLKACEVHPYNIATLLRLLAERANSDIHTIEAKRHRIYLEEYFTYIDARTIVLETDYTDRDFLEDFAGYYVRCFKDYPRRCARLHFFDIAFDETDFSTLLAAEATSLTTEQLQSAYLGFLVIKPLPRTFIGRIRGQIPVLLGIELYDPNGPVNPGTGRQFPFGFHAITAAGYSLQAQAPIVYPNSGFALKAFRMDKIYAHDDQVRPFARMEFLQGAHFSTYWLSPQSTGRANAFARFLMAPLYHKIRIPFQSVFGIVSSFSSLIEELQQHGIFMLPALLEWDIYLTSVNSLKMELHNLATLSGEYRRNILIQPMSRFLWRASALMNDVPILDFLFDATDIEQGPSFVGVIQHDPALGQILIQVAQVLLQADMVHARPDRHVIEWLANPTF